MRPNISAHFSGSKVNAADGRGAYNGGVNGQTGTGLQAVTAEAPNVDLGGWMVVELGSNNIGFASNERIWFIMQVVNAVSNDRCIAWVVPWVAFQDTNAQAWGADLDAWLPNQPCYAVIHWEDVAPLHPEWFLDLVHPNEAGKEALACMIGTAIGRPC